MYFVLGTNKRILKKKVKHDKKGVTNYYWKMTTAVKPYLYCDNNLIVLYSTQISISNNWYFYTYHTQNGYIYTIFIYESYFTGILFLWLKRTMNLITGGFIKMSRFNTFVLQIEISGMWWLIYCLFLKAKTKEISSLTFFFSLICNSI